MNNWSADPFNRETEADRRKLSRMVELVDRSNSFVVGFLLLEIPFTEADVRRNPLGGVQIPLPPPHSTKPNIHAKNWFR